jgi:hypothetical protein
MIEPVSKTRTNIIATNRSAGYFNDREVLRDASGHEIDELGRQ